MVAGYDAQKNKDRGGKSFGAFAASMDGNFGRYYSRAMFHEGHEEISQFIGQMTSEALRAYQKQNGKLPTRILFYRWVFWNSFHEKNIESFLLIKNFQFDEKNT